MSCNLSTTTTLNCTPCVHPLEHAFDLAGVGVLNDKNKTPFNETLDIILDKGIYETNCKFCCPDCDNVYVLASVETFLKFTEAIYGTGLGVTCSNQEYFSKGCCTNVHAAVETYLKYEEAVLQNPDTGEIDPNKLADFPTCCNGFTECLEELTCWLTSNLNNRSGSAAEILDRIADKGIVEYGNIINNCTGSGGSSLCKFAELLAKYYDVDKNAQRLSSRAEVMDRILDKGIVVYCNPDLGEIFIGSVETFILRHAQPLFIDCQPA